MNAVDAGFDDQLALTAELVKFPSVRGADASSFARPGTGGRAGKIATFVLEQCDFSGLRTPRP